MKPLVAESGIPILSANAAVSVDEEEQSFTTSPLLLCVSRSTESQSAFVSYSDVGEDVRFAAIVATMQVVTTIEICE